MDPATRPAEVQEENSVQPAMRSDDGRVAAAPTPPVGERPRRSVTLRSVTLGLTCVAFICGLAPLNDFAINNTFLVGNFLPVGLVLALLALVLVLNAPLHRFAPRSALAPGELAVAMSMMMVACTIPGSGLMRYLPASIIGMHAASVEDMRYAAAVRDAGLPDWLFPTFATTDPATRGNEPIARDFLNFNTDPSLSWHQRVPWRAWARPAVAWGTLVAALYGACLCISLIAYHQWARNERLSFPLAGVYLSLLEAPAPGRSLNATLRARSFWIAAGAVFAVHGFNALSVYQPNHVPRLALGYDLAAMLSDPPLSYLSAHFKRATVYFTIVGICFFLQGSVAFSLWGTLAAYEVVNVVLQGTRGSSMTDDMQVDQNLGAMIAFALTLAWVGRAHWAMVFRHMVGRRRAGDHRGDFVGYAVAGWGLLLCVGGMVTWLMLVGASVLTSIWISTFVLLCLTLVSRVVAETGLVFVQVRATVHRPLQYVLLAAAMPQQAARTTPHGAFMASWFNQLFTHDLREGAMPFQTQALRVGDSTIEGHDRRGRLGFVLALGLALAVGYVIAGTSTLAVEYNYGSTLEVKADSPLNPYAVNTSTRWMLDAVVNYSGSGPRQSHSSAVHVAGGGLLTGLMGYLRLHYAWWPFHPIGFLLVYTYPMRMIWFSVLLGWLAKSILVRFGGAPMIRAARPVFLGLIIGECAAAAFWLLVALAMLSFGHAYHAIRLLPT